MNAAFHFLAVSSSSQEHLAGLLNTCLKVFVERWETSAIGFATVLLCGVVYAKNRRPASKPSPSKTTKKALSAKTIGPSDPARFFAKAVAFLVFVALMFASVRGMTTMQGKIEGDSAFQEFSSVVLLPKERGDGLIVATLFFADQGGRFTIRWMVPGDYQLLIASYAPPVFRYSIAHCSKGWFQGKESFPTNPRSMDFFGRNLDKFHTNKEQLPEGAAAILALPKRPGFSDGYYLLIGHADSSGSEKQNRPLGLARAREVALQLEEQGVPANHIIIATVGSDYPIAKAAGDNNLALDRRVEMIKIPDPYAVSPALPRPAASKSR